MKKWFQKANKWFEENPGFTFVVVVGMGVIRITRQFGFDEPIIYVLVAVSILIVVAATIYAKLKSK